MFKILFLLIAVSCYSPKTIEVKKVELHKDAVLEQKPVYWFIEGIDDTCDTNIYKCIDMRSLEYQSRMKVR